ncbi:STAS domain-containing protein [Nonomuraea sp. NPDC049152]
MRLGHRHLVIDMGGMSFIDSTGIRILPAM